VSFPQHQQYLVLDIKWGIRHTQAALFRRLTMRKVTFGATFFGVALAVRAAVAESATIHPVLGIPAILLGLALAGLVIVLPALLVSTALRKFFNHRDNEFDESEERLFVLPSAMGARPSAIAAKR
jgi:hypothetical protein